MAQEIERLDEMQQESGTANLLKFVMHDLDSWWQMVLRAVRFSFEQGLMLDYPPSWNCFPCIATSDTSES